MSQIRIRDPSWESQIRLFCQAETTRMHFQDTLKWLKGFLDGERRILEELRAQDNDIVDRTLAQFDGKLISEVIGDTVDSTFKSYYEHFCNRTDRTDLNDHLKICREASAFYG